MRRGARAVLIGCAVCVLGLAGAAAGQTERDLESAVSALKQVKTPEEAMAALDRVIEVRRGLIDALERAGGGPRLDELRLELAENLWLRLYLYGREWSVLVGVPTPAQLESVAAAADEMDKLLGAIGNTKRWKTTLLRAGVVGPGAEQRRLAAEALASVPGEPVDAGEAARKSLVEIFTGDPAAVERARGRLTALMEPGGPAVDPEAQAAVLLVWCAAARDEQETREAVERIRAARSREPFVIDGEPDTQGLMHSYEAAAMALVREHARSGGGTRLLAEAGRELMQVAAIPGIASTEYGALSIPLWKLSALGDRLGLTKGTLAQLPAEWTFARALTTGRVDLYQAVVARADSGWMRPHALWELATIKENTGDLPGAVQALVRLVRDHPDSPLAREASTAVVARAEHLPELREHMLGALEAAIKFEPKNSALRVRAAEVLINVGGEYLLQALNMLEPIGPGDAEAARAVELFGWTAQAAFDTMRGNLWAMRPTDTKQFDARLRDELLPMVRSAEKWLASRGAQGAVLADVRLVLGEALVASGKAAAALDVLTAAEADATDQTRLAVALGSAEIAADGAHEARGVKRLMRVTEDEKPSRTPAFWEAWTALLEHAHRDPSQRGAARAQVLALEALDPQLGGEPWRSRLGALKR